MRYISYIEILTADFKTPVESMAPSLLTGILIMGIIWLVYRFSHIKILDRFVCSKKIMLVWLLFISYVIVVIETAFFSREPGSRKQVSLKLLETWGNTFQMHAYFLENIIMFIPLGILLPVLFRHMRKMKYCVATGFCCSCLIEAVQFITQRGFLQVDDVVTNAAGALGGWLIWCLIGRFWEVKGVRHLNY